MFEKKLPAMMTLEAAYIVPVFFLIIFGGVRLGTKMYTSVKASAEAIQENKDIDAVKNFRYASLGEDVLSFIGGGSSK